MVTIDQFDIFAFVVFGVLLVAGVVIVVVLGSLPGKIAARRRHPQASAIAAAGWISLATVFTLWPIAFIGDRSATARIRRIVTCTMTRAEDRCSGSHVLSWLGHSSARTVRRTPTPGAENGVTD